jgi:hypothetical protein
MNRRSFLWIAALALSGVAAGHSVAYYLAVPNAGHRNALLAQTGHSYWNVAITVAILLELTGVLGLAVRHFRAGLAGTSSLQLTFPQLARRLAAMQVAAFSALEVTERVRSGIPANEMFHNHLFPIGVAIQVLVACAGALLLRWLGRAAEAVGRLCSRRPAERRATAAVRRRQPLDLPALSLLCEALRGRAPPGLLASIT